MLANFFITIATFVAISNAENVGWKSYFVENPTEFHDIPLSWESGNQTSVPSWLSGIYVRNGPAQVFISLLDILSIKDLTLTFFNKGPFKYYVIMFFTFLGPPTHLFDDLQYCKSSKIAIFFADVILEVLNSP